MLCEPVRPFNPDGKAMDVVFDLLDEKQWMHINKIICVMEKKGFRSEEALDAVEVWAQLGVFLVSERGDRLKKKPL